MSNISFDNVYLLFLIIPLVAIIAVPFALAVRKENVNGHNVASLVIHVLIALLVCFAVAGTTVTSVITRTEVYVVADVSYSADRNLATVDSYINNVRDSLPSNSRMGVVVFGRDYELLTELGGQFESVTKADVDDSATDIGAALSYTSGLFHEGVIKRIVLITDGKDTDPNGFGELSGVVNSLYENNIYVDAIYVDDNLPEDSGEVQISSVDYSNTTFLGSTSVADVVVQSGSQCNAVLRLEVNIEGSESWQLWPNENSGERAVTLSQGSNIFNFDLCTTMAGTLNYRLTVISEAADYTAVNNTYEFTQKVVEKYKVLIVTEKRADITGVQQLYGENAEIDECVVTEQMRTVPCTVEELCDYDEIILANIDVRKIRNYASFIDAVNTVVSAFGKSLTTYGNLYIQNQDEEVLTQLEDMLPVRYGSAQQDPKLVTFVIDNSLSMYQNGQLTRAKNAVIAMMDNFLNPEDWVSVVSFYGDTEIIYTASQLSTNRDAIVEAVQNIELKQGTDIGAGLKRAYDNIANMDFVDKQVFLFSDGLSYHAANLDPTEVTSDMYDDGIYTSAVFMGSTAPNDDGTMADAAGYRAMQFIASAGRGGASEATNFYIVNSDDSFDEIIFGDIADNTTDAIISTPSPVTIASIGDAVVDGGEISSLPDVGGYYYSRTKSSANTVLTVEFVTNSGTKTQVPLYAYWSYGNGRVSTLTTGFSAGLSENDVDPANGWLSSWLNDDDASKVISNIGKTNIPKERVEYPYTLSSEYADGYASFEITPAKLNGSAKAAISITLPDGTVEERNMSFTSSSYTFGFIPEQTGRYSVTVTYTAGTSSYTAHVYLTVPYLSEYNAFASFDAATLNRLLNGRGVVSEDGNLALVNHESELATYTVSLTMPFLIAAVSLFVVDIIIRKLKWNDIKSLFVKIK